MVISSGLKAWRNNHVDHFRGANRTYIVRLLHVEDGPRKNLPFKITSKGRMATKILLFFGFGFSIPFVSCYWQLETNINIDIMIKLNMLKYSL
ncbi:hypothetical protein PNEG_02456 [Pneumocystis murina B123]|uniref:Cytochrome c oxidase subunit 8, mitochondrial n=1 Tax=Pneumocystis murina (strain B123) TaxID=1069680 RepID=M7NKF0_PNEMU|nr:hypothetical protein PNEG_02456 [Pneumocystis murina B123]EMR09113.1 hypothetical protein PNEG_02456 [Pneumocystis murina B123]